MSGVCHKGWYYTVFQIRPTRSGSDSGDIVAKDVWLPIGTAVDALQDVVHKECDGVRAGVSIKTCRPPCNPLATQCPRCNNKMAECDFGQDVGISFDDLKSKDHRNYKEAGETCEKFADLAEETCKRVLTGV